MKDWLAANAFFVGLALIAAGALWGGAHLVYLLGLDQDTERYVLALVAFAAVGVALFAGVLFLKTRRR